MTPRERQALIRIIFYLFGCLSYIAGTNIPDSISKEIEILQKGKNNDAKSR